MADDGRMPRRILHTSDLHLRFPADKACHGLESLVNLAIKSKVELVIVAGDLFDNFMVEDDLLRFAVEQLRRLAIDTVILPGNHDCLVPNSVYQRTDFWQSLANVQIFRAPEGETLLLPDLGISVWGKPIVSYIDDCRPLAGLPRLRRQGQWHIAVAHGYYADGAPSPFPRLGITGEEIATSCQDYIALGHWDRFRCVRTAPVKAYYCDSPAAPFPYNTVNIVDLTEDAGIQVSRQRI